MRSASSRTTSREIPFSQMGGLGKAYQVFGDQLTVVLDELNERLAAWSFRASLEEVIDKDRSGLLTIPPHWVRVRIGDVASIQNGFAFNSKGFQEGAGFPLIRIRDIRKVSTEVGFVGGYDDQYVVQPGDLLVGMDGDFNVAIWMGRQGLLNQRVCRITPNEAYYDRRFLFYALPGYLAAINAHTSSVTVKHLSSRTVADIPLPLPNSSEQRRIVAKLDELFSELDAGVAALERAQTKLKRYRALGAQGSGRGEADRGVEARPPS